MQKTWAQSLGQEDPLEKNMASHSSILSWRILWTEEPCGLQVHRVTKSQTQLKLLSMHAGKFGASLVAQLAKNPPALWETWFLSLGWEDPLGKEKATTPVFWPGEFHVLYSLWGRKE